MGFPGGAGAKDPTCQCRRRNRCGFDPWVEQIPWRRAWQPTPVLSPGDAHGQRSLVGSSPWGHKETGLSTKCQQGSQHTVWLHGERLMKSFKYDDCIYEKSFIHLGKDQPVSHAMWSIALESWDYGGGLPFLLLLFFFK